MSIIAGDAKLLIKTAKKEGENKQHYRHFFIYCEFFNLLGNYYYQNYTMAMILHFCSLFCKKNKFSLKNLHKITAWYKFVSTKGH